jgi:hypothetical protein
MIGRLAVRSLTAHPVRSGVLAAGFGIGVAVMAILLGVAQIVLEQSRAPALVGGGDVWIRLSEQVPGRLVLSGGLQSDALRSRIRAAAPTHTSTLFLLHDGRATRVRARGGIPSLERALGDDETSGIGDWRDSAADVEWTENSPDKVLRSIDRFHPIPDAPDWSGSWAEWLYFNGRANDSNGRANENNGRANDSNGRANENNGRAPNARFYLTFMVGPATSEGRRSASVRLQLDRGGEAENFTASQSITETDALQAPDLTIGRSFVRLEGMRYLVHVDLAGERGRRVRGDLTVDASPTLLVPPFEMTGARGWRTGYVVPVMSGRLGGALTVSGPSTPPGAGERIDFTGGTGYHDHNWGFWQGVSWRWGQVQHTALTRQGQHEDLSLLYGRVIPPPEAADPSRIPGLLGVLGPDGPLGYATNISITETDDERGNPRTILVRGRSADLDVEARFDVEQTTRSGGLVMLRSDLDFFQMRGTYTVTGRVGSRMLSFSAPGSAETFRSR